MTRTKKLIFKNSVTIIQLKWLGPLGTMFHFRKIKTFGEDPSCPMDLTNLKMKLHLCITNEAEQMKTKMTVGIVLFRTDEISRQERT
jgi:hypothetical protein